MAGSSSFKFTKETSIVALVFFIIYTFYGMLNIPFPQYLTSLAVGGIAYGIFNSFEIAAVFLLAINFVFPLFSSSNSLVSGKKEGFTNAGEVSSRIAAIRRKEFEPEIVGVGSPMSEGFENPNADGTLNTSGKVNENEKEQLSTGVSTPAPVASPSAAPALPASLPAEVKDKIVAATEPAKNALPPVTAPAESFQDGQAGLFKLGQIPTDTKGGFHIDAGTTVINALNALKPDQIQMMTKDTKQLIDTQKSLMSMLKTFSPMVNEGKQMMDTFQSMFGAEGAANGSLGTASSMLAKIK